MKKQLKIYQTNQSGKESFLCFTEVEYTSYNDLQIFANQLRSENVRVEFEVESNAGVVTYTI